MIVLGIDPGLDGAFVWYDGIDILSHYEVQTFKAKGRGREIDWAAMNNFVDFMHSLNGTDHAFIELVNARPNDGSSSAFKFGYNAGGKRGIIAAYRIPITPVTPSKWKRAMSLPTGSTKQHAASLASDLFPKYAAEFRGPRGGIKDGVAEAALIAKYGHDQLS